METFEIDRSAPATGRAAMLIRAPIGLVWDRIASIADWPSWNPAVEVIELSGPVEPGTTFSWEAGGLRIRSRLEIMEPPFRIGWTGVAPLIRARHVFRLADNGDATDVQTEESFAGLLARLLPRTMSAKIVASLEQGLASLKTACEADAARGARHERLTEENEQGHV